jgi:hypothetical protein
MELVKFMHLKIVGRFGLTTELSPRCTSPSPPAFSRFALPWLQFAAFYYTPFVPEPRVNSRRMQNLNASFGVAYRERQ